MSEVGRFHKTASPLCVGSADGTLRREYGFDSVFRLITLKDQIKAVLTGTKERLDNWYDPDTSKNGCTAAKSWQIRAVSETSAKPPSQVRARLEAQCAKRRTIAVGNHATGKTVAFARCLGQGRT